MKISEDQATFNRVVETLVTNRSIMVVGDLAFYTNNFKEVNVVVSEAQTFLKRFIEAKSNGYFKGQ